MKAVQILGSRGNHELALSDSMDPPSPSGREILIKVHAAVVTTDEVSWVDVYKTPTRIPGHDISGIIAQLGPDYEGPLLVGDEVFAMLHADRGQGQAEYATALPDEVALKPKTVTHAAAAALPIPILTAWEALSRHAKLAKGSRILVTGASGAVGVMLVQLAKQLFDAKVVALASSQKHDYVRALGAAEAVDYKVPDWNARVSGIDAVFDTVGGSVLSKSWGTLKNESGVVITVADPPPPWAFSDVPPEESKDRPHARYIYFVLSPDSDALGRAARLIDGGNLRILPVVEFPFDEALKAWEYAAQRGRQGKAVISFITKS